MNLISGFRKLTEDTVRMTQFFMLSRQVGVILSSVVIARSLPLEQVGVFEMLMLCGYLMTFFWSEALLKGYLANPRNIKSEFDSASVLWFFILAALVSMSILVLGQRLFIPLFAGRESLAGLNLFALYQTLIIPLWVAPFLGVLRRYNGYLISVYVLLGPSLACWFGFQTMPNLNGVLIGLLSYALVGLGWVLMQTRLVSFPDVRKLIKTLWPVTWPLAMYAISTGLARSFDLWVVAREFSESVFAVFRYGAREFPVVVALAGGLSTMMIPKLKNSEAFVELKRRSTRLMHYSYPIVATVIFFSPVLFTMFFGEAYRESAIIFNIYLLLSLTQLFFPQSILIAREATRLLWFVSVFELVVNIAMSLFLLQYFGLMGIAFGTCIAFATEKLILFYFVWRRFRVSPWQLFNPVVWLAYASLILASFISSKWIFGI